MAGKGKLNAAGALNGYDCEVVVGYHPIDNQPFGQVQWVSSFCSELEIRVKQTFRGPAKPRLQQWDCTHVHRRSAILGRSATLVAVLSSAFEGPADYQPHWDAFGKIIDPADSKTRLFKAYKGPCEVALSPAEGKGYQFWDFDPESDRALELLFLPQGRDRHLRAINRLAHDVTDTLRVMGNEADPRPRVYLAGSCPALKGYYDHIYDFLRSRCVISTESQADLAGPEDYERTLREELQKCALSIHLLDPAALLTPDQGDSCTAIQLRLASELVRQRRLLAIVWSPSPRPEADGAVPEGLGASTLPENFDNLTATTLAGLKARILERLSKPIRAVDEMNLILIQHQDDAVALGNLSSRIEHDNPGWKVKATPEFDPKTFSNVAYDDLLDEADAVVICWGNAPELWFWRMHQMLLAYFGRGCNLSLDRFSVFYHLDRDSQVDTPFRKIATGDQFLSEDLAPFLNDLDLSSQGPMP